MMIGTGTNHRRVVLACAAFGGALLSQLCASAQSTSCPQDIEKLPRAIICGTVTVEDVGPAADVAVEISDGFDTERTTRTDRFGHYILTGLPYGWYHLDVTTPTHMGGDKFMLYSSDVHTCDLTLHGASGVFGFVSLGFRVLGHVPVTIENTATGRKYSVTSDGLGQYRIEGLLPGEHRVTLDLAPFKPVERTVVLPPYWSTAVDLRLELRAEEHLTIRSDSIENDSSTNALVSRFSRELIDRLPLENGRTLQSLQALLPGIIFTESVGTLAQFTAVGQRRYANRLSVDGASSDLAIDVGSPGIGEAGSGALPITSTLGGTQTLIPLSAVEQIEVQTTNAASEQARTPGAQTTIVTRSGSDRLNGTGFLDIRPNALSAKNWFENAGTAPRRENRLWSSSVSVGGPAVPKHVFYFGAFEQQRVDRSVMTVINVPSESVRAPAQAAAGALLDTFPLPNGIEDGSDLTKLAQRFPASSKLSSFSLRLDANLAARHSVFARINLGRSQGDELDPDLQLPRFSFTHTESTRTNLATAGLTSVLSSHIVNELRVNGTSNEGSLIATTAQPLPLSLLVPSGTSSTDAWVRASVVGGPGGFLLSGRSDADRQQQVQVADTLSWLFGQHLWRLGVEYRRVLATTNPAPNRYTYQFGSVANLLRGRFSVLVEHDTTAHAVLERFAAFVQDSFRVSPRLSLDFGVRYGLQPAPRSNDAVQPLLLDPSALPIVAPLAEGTSLWQTSWGHLAPRVAAAYQLNAAGGWETVLRAGSSLVFDERTAPGASVFGRGYPYIQRRLVTSTVFPAPEATLAMSFPAPFGPTDLNEYYAFQRNLRTPRTYSWNVGVEQAFGRSDQLGVAYVGTCARGLPYWTTYYTDGGAPINLFTSDASSDYNALLVRFTHRLLGGLTAQASYTFSHAIDTDSGESLSGQPPLSVAPIALNRGSADFDRRHVLAAVASYELPAPRRLHWLLADWQIDAAGKLQSGAPFSITSERDFEAGPYLIRPDSVPDAIVWIADSSSATGRRLDPEAFQFSGVVRQGTLGRNTLRGTPLRQVDLSLSRSIRLRGINATIRIDAFNVFNIPNYASPVSELDRANFGRPTRSYADALGTGTLSHGGLVPLQQLGGPRMLQLSMRLAF